MRDAIILSIEEVDGRAGALRANLTASELETLDRLLIDKRRRDWLAGRVAAKMAGQRVTGLPLSAHEVRTITEGPERGRPYLTVGATSMYLSITHAGDAAAAIVSDKPVGLDIEVVQPRPEIETLAFSARERRAWIGLTGLERSAAVTRAWCEKEAISKWRGVGFRDAFSALTSTHTTQIRRGTFVHRGVLMAWAHASASAIEQAGQAA